MTASRQPKISATLGIFAGMCALLWLVGIAGRLGNCADHEGACAAQASPVHKHDPVSPHGQGHSHDAGDHHATEMHQHAAASHHPDGTAPQGCAGTNGGEEQCRCSAAIQAFVQTPPAVVIPKPVSQPVLIISLLCAARQHVFAAPPSETLRRAKPRDWVFTPEVCLGPAFHSVAPPASV